MLQDPLQPDVRQKNDQDNDHHDDERNQGGRGGDILGIPQNCEAVGAVLPLTVIVHGVGEPLETRIQELNTEEHTTRKEQHDPFGGSEWQNEPPHNQEQVAANKDPQITLQHEGMPEPDKSMGSATEETFRQEEEGIKGQYTRLGIVKAVRRLPQALLLVPAVFFLWFSFPWHAKNTTPPVEVPLEASIVSEEPVSEITELPKEEELHEAAPKEQVPVEAKVLEEPLTIMTKRTPDGSMGVYLTGRSVGRSDDFFEKVMAETKRSGGNALVIDAKEHDVFFESSSPSAQEFGALKPEYRLTEVVENAHGKGLQVIIRFVAGKDIPLARAKPETQIIHPETGRSVGNIWVDLGNETVHSYNRELLMEIIAAGVDEINIDYIRYPTEYTPIAIGWTLPEKIDHVESFVKMARETIDASPHNVRLGISTYAILGWEYEKNMERLAQDIQRLAPYVDVISPMAYPASFAPHAYYTGETRRSRMYELVYKTMLGYQKLIPDDAWKLRPWIQGYRVSSKDLKDQIDAVFDSGSCGFTIWSPSNQYVPLFTLAGGVTAPAHCSEAL